MKLTLNKVPFIFVCLAVFLLSACTYTPWHRNQSELFLNKGIAYLQVGQYNNALKELLEAEKYHPRNPKIHYYLAMSYHGKGMNDKAIEKLQKAISLDNNYSEAYNFLGWLYSERGLWDKAIEEFEKALSNYLYDTPSLALYNMAWAYYSKKDYKTALAKYQEALNTDPATRLRPQIEKNMGLVFFEQSDYLNAIYHFQQSVKLNPNLFDAYFYLGEAYFKIGNKSKARKAFESVVDLAPKSDLGKKASLYLQALR